MKVEWEVIRVPTYPQEWKVVPKILKAWENNNPDNYFEDEFEALLEAERRDKTDW